MTETSNVGVVARFDYSDEPPQHWDALLSRLRESGTKKIRARVPWGAHESVRGARDFSRASRLRLEKFLQAVHAAGLTVELVVGFFAGRETFPSWTFGGEMKALVPAALLHPEDDCYSLVSLPSVFDDSVLESFGGFVEEVLGIASLYVAPGGPLESVRLSLGVLGSDLNLFSAKGFLGAFRAKYGDIRAFNTLYQSAFKDLDVVNTRAGFRTMMDRRPWIASADYQSVRKGLLTDRLCSLFGTVLAKTCHFDWAAPGEVVPSAGWELWIDGTMVEVDSEEPSRCFPFLPYGILSTSAVGAFRVGEYLAEAAGSARIPVCWLRSEAKTSKAETVVVVCGKYLSRAVLAELDRHLSRGGRAQFPLGRPHYDEKMEAWAPPLAINAATKSVSDRLWDDIRSQLSEASA